MNKIYLIIILIILIYYLSNNSNIEKMTLENSDTDDKDFYDEIFENVIHYPNEYEKDNFTEENIGKIIKLGIDKCKTECKGDCVEYGLTGHSYCFNPL